MEFLYKLYDNEYFGIGLFIVIAILIFLFLLILFFGKKDEKNRKLEETKKLELENANAFKETEETIEKLDIPEIKQPIINNEINQENISNNQAEKELNESDEIQFNIPKLDEPVFESINDNIEEKPNTAEINMENNEIEPINEIDINKLFQTNLENIQIQDKTEEISKDEEHVLPKLDTLHNLDYPNSDIEENIIENTKEIPKAEEMVLPKLDAPYSSVYPNNTIEDKKNENTEGKSNSVMFELPKKVEEKKEEIKLDNSNKVDTDNLSDFDSLFGDIETEVYDINK